MGRRVDGVLGRLVRVRGRTAGRRVELCVHGRPVFARIESARELVAAARMLTKTLKHATQKMAAR